MNLRPATPDDGEQIAALHAESWRTAYRGIFPDYYLDNDVIDDRRIVWKDAIQHPSPKPGRDRRRRRLHARRLHLRLRRRRPADGDPSSTTSTSPPHLKRSGIGTLLMREGAAWLRDHYPSSGVYLWALAANAPARRFYERLDAKNPETIETPIPGPSTALSCRYTWATPNTLHQACDRLQAS